MSRANFCLGPIERNFKRCGILIKALSHDRYRMYHTVRASVDLCGQRFIYINALYKQSHVSPIKKKKGRCQKSVIDPDSLTSRRFTRGLNLVFIITYSAESTGSACATPSCRASRTLPSLYVHMPIYYLIHSRYARQRWNIFTSIRTHYEHSSIFVIATCRVSIISLMFL